MKSRLSSSSSMFFSPSFLARTSPRFSTTRPSTSRGISFSSNGSSSRPRSGAPSTRVVAPSSSKAAAESAPNAASSSSSSSSTSTPSAGPAKTLTPLAPVLKHAVPELICFDKFFSLHRPLLELPIRLPSRRSVAPIASLDQRIAQLDTPSAPHSVVPSSANASRSEADIKRTADGEEIVEVVDLDADGTPIGPSYMATMSAVRAAAESEEAVIDESESQLEELATEAAQADFEDGGSPYEQWLLGEHDPGTYTVKVARAIASRQPFVPPPVPQATPSRQLPPPATQAASLSPQTLSDLSFLQPFPSVRLASSSTQPPSVDDFTRRYLDPLSASEASQVTDSFLSNALLSYRFASHDAFARSAGEKLALAQNAYDGVSNASRRPWDEQRKRGEIRMWSEKDGWTTVDLSGGREGVSPFLPAEMVDLDWEDEQYEIRMDSTKRKRKKKITKHKYKKRRKAQKALRQRLGK